MDDAIWADRPLTRAATEADEPALDDDPEFEIPVAHRLMQAIAAQSRGRLVEVTPGHWYESKIGSTPPTGV